MASVQAGPGVAEAHVHLDARIFAVELYVAGKTGSQHLEDASEVRFGELTVPALRPRTPGELSQEILRVPRIFCFSGCGAGPGT